MAEPVRVPTHEFRRELKALLAAVERTGEPLVVTRYGRPVARLIPPTENEVA